MEVSHLSLTHRVCASNALVLYFPDEREEHLVQLEEALGSSEFAAVVAAFGDLPFVVTSISTQSDSERHRASRPRHPQDNKTTYSSSG